MKLFKVTLVEPSNPIETSYILAKTVKGAIHDMLSFRADGWHALNASIAE